VPELGNKNVLERPRKARKPHARTPAFKQPELVDRDDIGLKPRNRVFSERALQKGKVTLTDLAEPPFGMFPAERKRSFFVPEIGAEDVTGPGYDAIRVRGAEAG
jgi:hypothetical protein